MVVGQEISECDVVPVQVEGGNNNIVDPFRYLGSRNDEVIVEIDYRIAKASKPLVFWRYPYSKTETFL